MTDKLKPCPFCGGEAKIVCGTDGEGDGERSNIFWTRCIGCSVEKEDYHSEAEAIKAWNTRPKATAGAFPQED